MKERKQKRMSRRIDAKTGLREGKKQLGGPVREARLLTGQAKWSPNTGGRISLGVEKCVMEGNKETLARGKITLQEKSGKKE